ncbi:transcriptional regulator NrdR [Candidatus Woesearchaeota archaeon]|nr:transcriptional regulator NrdR [Candidatus Woesearchaeota archaeon]
MKCPFCNEAETKVVDSREAEESEVIRRRRECISCNERFTTYERLEKPTLLVIKKDKTRESFDRDKLMKGMMRACEKRPIAAEKIEQTMDQIEKELRNTTTGEVSSQLIGQLVMHHLQKLDEIAYVRFASVYREFRDAQQFMKELQAVIQKKPLEKAPKLTVHIE